jgi:hypothetical protein
MVLKRGIIGKQIKYTVKGLKPDVGEGCSRSVEPILSNEEVLHRVKGERNLLHTIRQKRAN